jgi:D-alanyl-lipoteichoic acid acyltransferase DltB (MBOAT superfamily)
MFPQLVAGPIVRATDLIPQLATPGHFNAENRWWGLRVASWGYLKKVVVADSLAPIVREAFANTPDLGLGWWMVAALFAMQIYCDFSGYSDIACGLARWMGYQFPQNFRHPYAAAGPREFWSRWHITLSTWFRDYVYIPLGGSRRGEGRTVVNQAFTMVLSGLWHGANWTFVAWGAFHGGLLILERVIRGADSAPYRGWIRIPVVICTFLAVLIGWVLFRAESMAQAGTIIEQMFSTASGPMPWFALPTLWVAIGVLGIGAAHHLAVTRSEAAHISRLPMVVQCPVVCVALFASIFLRGPGSDFIYFQF